MGFTLLTAIDDSSTKIQRSRRTLSEFQFLSEAEGCFSKFFVREVFDISYVDLFYLLLQRGLEHRHWVNNEEATSKKAMTKDTIDDSTEMFLEKEHSFALNLAISICDTAAAANWS